MVVNNPLIRPYFLGLCPSEGDEYTATNKNKLKMYLLSKMVIFPDVIFQELHVKTMHQESWDSCRRKTDIPLLMVEPT